jgi:outer membrane protein assembly factor BamB
MADNIQAELVRYDLDRQEQVWSSPILVLGELASDGELVFAVRHSYVQPTEGQAGSESGRLTAIDHSTGETVWEGPELATRFYASHAVVISESTVYATDHLGNVVAVNKDDGSLLWQYPESFAKTTWDEKYIVSQPFNSPELAVNDSAVF